MNRLLWCAAILLGIGVGLVAGSGVPRAQFSPMVQGAASGSNFTTNCSQSNAFLNTQVGGPGHGMSTTIAGYYDTMICGMVTDGNWSDLDLLYILAAPTQAIAQLNLVSSSFPLTVGHSGGTFTANSNYQGDGSSSYLNTGFNPSTAGGHFSLNSGEIGEYILNARSTSSTATPIGTQDASNVAAYYPYFTGGGFLDSVAMNNSGSVFFGLSSGPTSTQGLNISSRFSANGLAITVYQTGGPYNGNSTTKSAGAIPNAVFYVGALNNNGTATQFSSDKIAAIYVSSQTITASTMSSRINAFMTSQGINVY